MNTLLAVEAVTKYVTMHPPEWTFDPKELEQIADFAIRHDLFVFTVEYCDTPHTDREEKQGIQSIPKGGVGMLITEDVVKKVAED